jgi:hypothetical protein
MSMTAHPPLSGAQCSDIKPLGMNLFIDTETLIQVGEECSLREEGVEHTKKGRIEGGNAKKRRRIPNFSDSSLSFF